ncbi:MAG: SPOR domain-containing protein [Eggerthellaceae bacterium]|nr:SPOR domain-containing protein [Eggerthellaceae bacterium]
MMACIAAVFACAVLCGCESQKAEQGTTVTYVLGAEKTGSDEAETAAQDSTDAETGTSIEPGGNVGTDADATDEATTAQAASASESEAPGSQSNSADVPFWGVWVGASMDESEANGIADSVRAQGFEADVVLTTDWSNLNAEPWYVITVGRHSTEEQANALVGTVQSSGWPDAYVKYSGDHK